jgi:hypothetical protein
MALRMSSRTAASEPPSGGVDLEVDAGQSQLLVVLEHSAIRHCFGAQVSAAFKRTAGTLSRHF